MQQIDVIGELELALDSDSSAALMVIPLAGGGQKKSAYENRL